MMMDQANLEMLFSNYLETLENDSDKEIAIRYIADFLQWTIDTNPQRIALATELTNM